MRAALTAAFWGFLLVLTMYRVGQQIASADWTIVVWVVGVVVVAHKFIRSVP